MRLGSRLCACEAYLCVCRAPGNLLLANRTVCEDWHRRHTVLFERSMVGAGAVAPFYRGLGGARIKSSSINSGNAIL
jgi:hypothetical protein